jgi:hypothetical protein
VFYRGNRGADLVLDQSMIENVCNERTMQWVLGGLAVAAGVVGTYLLFGTEGSTADAEGEDAEAMRLQLSPMLTREQRGLGLTLTF